LAVAVVQSAFAAVRPAAATGDAEVLQMMCLPLTAE
jgi:hypothetical protein